MDEEVEQVVMSPRAGIIKQLQSVIASKSDLLRQKEELIIEKQKTEAE
eukprot:gene13650-3986_t